MRYELSDYEWAAIKPFLPNKPRGIPRVNDRRVLNGIFWVLRSGAPWRDLPETYGPCTTCYNRFVRWRRAGVWDQIMDALAAGHDAAVQMIDTSVVRVHQHAACIADNNQQDMGRSRGGLTSKISRWWTPMVCRSISLSRQVKRTTTGCVRFSSAPYILAAIVFVPQALRRYTLNSRWSGDVGYSEPFAHCGHLSHHFYAAIAVVDRHRASLFLARRRRRGRRAFRSWWLRREGHQLPTPARCSTVSVRKGCHTLR